MKEKTLALFLPCLLFFMTVSLLNGQGKKIYNEEANAANELSEAIYEAAGSGKHVLIQAGGNWCSWCIEFNRFSHAEPSIDSLIRADYVIYHLNYSTANKNEAVFTWLGFPQRFGFPVFIILDEKGNRLHIQNSEYLENGKKSYDTEKVAGFLKAWNRKATDPLHYKMKKK